MTQLLPSTITFSHFTPVYGEKFLEYIGLVPTTASGENYEQGNLHDGYKNLIGKSCAAAFDSSADTNDTYCFMTREWASTPLDDSADVRGFFRMHPTLGFPTILDLHEWSLFARIQGGTLEGDGTTAVRYRDVTCYQFRVYVEGLTLVFETRKIVSGTASTLGSRTIFPLSEALNQVAAATIGLRLDVTGTSPVTIRTFALLISPITGLPFDALTLPSITDSSSPITSFGRIGFGLGTARTFKVDVAGVPVIPTGVGCDLIEIFENRDVNNVVTYRDEFQRIATAGLSAIGPDFGGVSGKHLGGRFSRDQFGPTDAGNQEILTRDPSAQRAYMDLDSATTNKAAVLLDHRPATDGTRQHRQVVLTLENGDHDSLGGGIVLFANQNPAVTSATGELGFTSLRGYAAVCKHTLSGNLRNVTLYRYDTAGVPKKIAELPDSGTGSVFGVGSQFTLAFEAYPTDGMGGFPQASVTLKVYIGGVQVPLEAVSGSPVGISVDSSGTVIDANDTRVTGGFAEGLYVCGATKKDFVYVDGWLENALHEPQEPPHEQPTAPFASEGVATESLDDILSPAWVVDVEHDAASIEVLFESGHRYTGARYTDTNNELWARRHWRLQSPPLTESASEDVMDFFAARLGAEEPFFFTDPRTEEELTVHFLEDSLRTTKLAQGTYIVEFELQEVAT